MSDPFHSQNLLFDPKEHRYSEASEGSELISVTRLIKLVITPFDRQGISYYVAKGKAPKEASMKEIKAIQQQTLDEWDQALEESIGHGNFLHDNIHKFLVSGRCDKSVMTYIHRMSFIWKQAYRFYSERPIWWPEYGVAGTFDIVTQRTKSKDSVFDVYDVKTNKSQKIRFDSVGRKGSILKHYNRFLLPPLDHLEQCNYVVDALQLSMYALMLQESYGIKIGRLAIIFIDDEKDKVTLYPVCYMKTDCLALCRHYRELKKLPFKIDDPGVVIKEKEKESEENSTAVQKADDEPDW